VTGSDVTAVTRPASRLITRGDLAAKRALDAISACIFLVLLSPLLLVIGTAVRLGSPGPIFYRARRVGFHGEELPILKFRKMHRDVSGPPLTVSDDQRLTRVGRFLATSKLDEVPQLWQVVTGEMSLVGPRPEDSSFVSLYPEAYARITQVKPGITGLAQLAFAEEGRILDREDRMGHYVERLLPQKVQLDLLYARERSLLMDLRILLWTAATVFVRRDVAVHRETGRLTLRRRRLRSQSEETTQRAPDEVVLSLGSPSPVSE